MTLKCSMLKYPCDLCDKPTVWIDDLPCGSTFGQLKIICRECAETHEVVVRAKRDKDHE